ncbi:response regulator [Patescibacteria group bacterium]
MGKKKIFIVDDSNTILLLFVSLVEDEPFEIKSFSSGKSALAAINEGIIPNLVVTDLNMPNMSGYEFINELRKIKKISNIPILLSSAENNISAVELKNNKVTGILPKPFTIASIRQCFKRVLRVYE